MRGRMSRSVMFAVALVALTACSGATDEHPATTPVAPPATSATTGVSAIGTSSASVPSTGSNDATTSTAATAPATAIAGMPALPAAAREHSYLGAEAFVRYFVEIVNAAWTRPAAGMIAAVSEPSCQSCSNLERTSASLVAAHARWNVPPLVVHNAASLGAREGDTTVFVVASITQQAASVVSDGHVQRSTPQKDAVKEFELRFAAAAWRLVEIRTPK